MIEGKPEHLKPCAGDCGRMTRPANVSYTSFPDAVIRWKNGYCSSCWEKHEAERPMTQREIQTLKALQSWNRRRDERLARMERMGGVQKFFPDIPDYNDKEVPGGKQTPKRSHKKKPPKDDSLGDAHDTIGTLSLTYRQDPSGMWDYVISTEDGAILTKRGSYRDSPQCKRHAKRQARRYLAGIPLDTGMRRMTIMAKKQGEQYDGEEFYEGPFRFRKDSRGEWRFSLLGENGEVMFQSEAYFNRGNARRGAKRVRERLLGDQEKK